MPMPTPSQPTAKKRPHRVVVKRQVQEILSWPTETVAIDYYDKENGGFEAPHTLLLFVPGNPGCIEWYFPLLEQLVSLFGVGFAAHGVSYAGHGATDELSNVQQHDKSAGDTSLRNTDIPWTVNGQVYHKISWIDTIMDEMVKLYPTRSRQRMPRFIFLTHSIGAFLVQRLLLLRPDIFLHTRQVIHLLPFLRMDAPQPKHAILSHMSKYPSAIIFLAQTMSRVCRNLPSSWLNHALRHSVKDDNGRNLAVSLLQQPHMARNFFELGLEEIRDLPQAPDTWALNRIAKFCPTHILFCGGSDHWSPEFHMDDLQQLQTEGKLSDNVYCSLDTTLRHDFVIVPEMVNVVVEYCLNVICIANEELQGENDDDGRVLLTSKL